MHIIEYCDSIDDLEISSMEEEYQDYDDCYLFMKNSSTLYYIKDRQIEQVQIYWNSADFRDSLFKFMQDEQYRYTLKRMQYDDILNLITRYTRHMPQHMASAACNDSGLTYRELFSTCIKCDEEHDVLDKFDPMDMLAAARRDHSTNSMKP
jgi:hypothetical protein